jgi:hypothetical protein
LPAVKFVKYHKNVPPRFNLACIPSVEALKERGYEQTYFWLGDNDLVYLGHNYLAGHINTQLYYKRDKEHSTRVLFNFTDGELLVNQGDLMPTLQPAFLADWIKRQFKEPTLPELKPSMNPTEHVLIRASDEGFGHPLISPNDLDESVHRISDFPMERVAYCLPEVLKPAPELGQGEAVMLVDLESATTFNNWFLPHRVRVIRLGGQWHYCQEDYLKPKGASNPTE